MNAAAAIVVICQYCDLPARQVTGRVIYPHRPDLFGKKFYRCAPCDAYVGCHPDGRPKGTLADPVVREARKAAHAVFDPLWGTFQAQRLAYPEERVPNKRLQGVMRTRAYEWLAEQIGIPIADTHIAMFDVAQCQRAVEIINLAKIDAARIRAWAKKTRAERAHG